MSTASATGRRLIVGVADMKMTKGPGHLLVTHGLGSCIGIALYDPVSHIGGLLHFMLPDSQVNPQRARVNPWMFADTGIPAFLNAAIETGASPKYLMVTAAGGAQFRDNKAFFAVGKRNHMVMRKILWQQKILLRSEQVGGTTSRALYLDLGNGRSWITSGGKEITL